MTMQIREIVLYRADGQKRHLKFRLGSVNIITGRSGTGKSAVIPILDYCLGRSTFTVPEGVIRESVAWYSVILHIRDGLEIFIAKPAPKASASSQSQAFMISASEVEAPDISALEINSNDAAIESLLSRELGISPNIHEPPEGNSRSPLRANVSHAKFLLFQEQGLIASRDMLFFRQSEPFIPQAIKDTLPYFLGAIEEGHLGLIEEGRRLRREIKLLERDLSERQAVSGGGVSAARGLMLEAMQVGLLAESEIPSSQSELRSRLKAAEIWKANQAPERSADDISRLRQEIAELRSASRQLSDSEQEARIFSRHAASYEYEISEQAARLESINLLPAVHDESTCPFCGTASDNLLPTAKKIGSRLQELNEQLNTVVQQRPKLADHLGSILIKQADIRQKIRQKQDDLVALEKTDSRAEAEIDRNSQIARVVGRISLYMESAPSSENVQIIQSQMAIKKSRLTEIDNLLARDRKYDILSSILNSIGSEMNRLSSGLFFEHKEFPMRFDLDNLTVVSDRPMRPFPMQRMGSGQNWLACHLLALLALHGHFRMNNRPVPGFMVLDQPSQVYFPSEDIYRSAGGSVERTLSTVRDITAVEALFNLLFDFAEHRGGDFQVIVLEHANLASERFQSCLIEEIWDGEVEALVPPEWIDAKPIGTDS